MDKQDELAGVIETALYGLTTPDLIGPGSFRIAAAVRSYMGSDEVVERGHAAIAGGVGEAELRSAIVAMLGRP